MNRPGDSRGRIRPHGRIVPTQDDVEFVAGSFDRLARQASIARESATRPAIQRAELRAMGLADDAAYPCRPTFQPRRLG